MAHTMRKQEDQEKITDKLYHIVLYTPRPD